MPKPMTIEISVEEIAFGKVFRTLDEMPGVVSIKIKGSGPNASAPESARKHGKASEGTTGKCVVFNFLLGKKKAVAPGVLADAIVAAGKSKNSIGNILYEAVKLKELAHSKDGYKLTPVGLNFLRNNCGRNK